MAAVLGCEDTTQCVCEVGQAREGPTCVPVHPAPPTGASPLCLHLAFWEAAVWVASSSPWQESDCSPWRCASGRRSGHGFGDTCRGRAVTPRSAPAKCAPRGGWAWPLNSALHPNRAFQTLRTHGPACGDSGQRGHTASTRLSVQGAFLALPRSPDS